MKSGECSTKSDIWSAGVVFWEILSDGNDPPYGKIASSDIASGVLSGIRLGYPDGYSKVPEVRDLFKVISKRCWLSNPEERFSARSLVHDINSRLSLYNESASHAMLEAGNYIPDPEFTYLKNKHVTTGFLPKQRKTSDQKYDYAAQNG